MAFSKTGCCGFPLPKAEYAERFPVAEVQQTFYQPPRISTLERWRTQVPSHFEFTLKAWQLITHTAKSPTFRRLKTKLAAEELGQCGGFQSTPVVRRAWETTRACAEALRARQVLFQCPASFTPAPENIERMQRFFTSLVRGELKLLWEPRGNWPEDLVLSLCRELDLVHAVDPFVAKTVTPEFIYFRLHGGQNFKHVFTDSELLRISQSVPTGVPSYVLFNNVAMLSDAERFQSRQFPPGNPGHSVLKFD